MNEKGFSSRVYTVENPFFEIIKFYMLGFISYIEWIVKEGEIDGD